MGMWRRVAGLAVVAMLMLVAAGGRTMAVYADPPATDPPTATVRTAEAAVQAAVEAVGDVYAGDCGQTVSPRDAGKVCSRLVAEHGGVIAYLVGRTFSEFSRWVFVAAEGAQSWRVAGSVPLDFFGPVEPPWPA